MGWRLFKKYVIHKMTAFGSPLPHFALYIFCPTRFPPHQSLRSDYRMTDMNFFCTFGSFSKPCHAKGGKKCQKSILAIAQNNFYTGIQVYEQAILAKRIKYYKQNWFSSTSLKQSYLIFSALITSKSKFTY